jgi:hypothetical protein
MVEIDPVVEFFSVHSFPNENKELDTIAKGEITLAHYTSAEAAYNIISSKKVYLRDARYTNDFSEINYGSHMFAKAFYEKYSHLYNDLFKKIDSSLLDKFNEIFTKDVDNLLLNNYIFCLCGHDTYNEEELLHGKLSMWRAYGGKSGVCFYFNNNVIDIDLPNPTFSKVNYWSNIDLESEMSRFYNVMNSNIDFISSNKKILLEMITNKFKNDLAFIKNPRFREENEWRFLCFPDAQEGKEYTVENIILRNTPQLVVSLPFSEIYKTSFNEILSHIVIGPSPYQHLVQRSISDLLAKHGFNNASDRVFLSDTPLRIE